MATKKPATKKAVVKATAKPAAKKAVVKKPAAKAVSIKDQSTPAMFADWLYLWIPLVVVKRSTCCAAVNR